MANPDFERLFGVNAAYAEKVYADYLAAPASVSIEWRQWFETQLPQEQRARVAPPGTTPAAAPPPPPAADAAAPRAPQLLTGIAAAAARHMTESLLVPTATSSRELPVKVLEENRHILNRHQQGRALPKIAFTQLIAFAMVRALQQVPAMTSVYVEQDGKPHVRSGGPIRLGIAVDVPGADGRRALLVPNVADAGALDFAAFAAAVQAQIDKARAGRLAPADFAGTNCTLTNPGTIGTMSSLPRLLRGQGCIVATGAITVPGAFHGAAPQTLIELGVGRVLTITCTYDHRVIQGAESGAFLDHLCRLLLGEDGFYEAVFRALAVPYRPLRFQPDRRPPLGSSLREAENLERAAGLMTYVRSYRVRGHLLADLDPLGYEPQDWPELDLSTYGFTLWDLERTFFSDGTTRAPFATLREIQATLQLTYCRHVGVEYMHIADPEQRRWLRERMEADHNEAELPKATMLLVLDQLVEAEAFERFLHVRFVGHKRFSLEGGETLLPVLAALIERAGEQGVLRLVLGMAHRGRLNILAHVLQKPLARIFAEFEGYLDPAMTQGSGDVKYHLGATAARATASGRTVELELASNPSHLEAVDPVVEGIARARQDQLADDRDRRSVLPVLIHGDAAFAGQGVVAETLQLSQLAGYRTHGTVHVVVNNQIGYTTSPGDSRSTPFCTDVAKAIQAPILHVNGDDPLAAFRMVRLAFDYRMQFSRDVVLDIVCYRRHGHNEADEPSFTQPLLYRRIERHPTVRAQYQDFLRRAGVLTEAELAGYDARVQQRLEESLDEVRRSEPPAATIAAAAAPAEWSFAAPAVPLPRLLEWNQRLLQTPAGFTPHPKVALLLQRRLAMLAGEQPIDFATAEALAFASLVTAGVPVRLAGQDSGRGTFSQRHAALFDHADGHRHVPLDQLAPQRGRFTVVDSLLSEAAALAFEYGYSVARPDGLTLWEAQFGDFANGAQIAIDQFVAAGEAKWGQRSGLVLLLPHGYDGQGPEHSSARLERFLQLCAEDNLRVAVPSTAQSYYQLLRQQALDPLRRPLVVLTPKSLLRRRDAGATAAELATGAFAPVLDDMRAGEPAPASAPARVTRVVCCSGKVYYDLHAARGDDRTIALVRFELLYPWPATAIAALRARYANAAFVWCQEEPANMGAWQHVRDRLPWRDCAARRPAASPATGFQLLHKAEQQELVARALRG